MSHPERRTIWCCGCGADVDAFLTTGRKVYPHRSDLARLPFWRCRTCRNFVGCHHKTHERTKPLGCIPTPEIKAIRQAIHRDLDPLWKGGLISRREAYKKMSEAIGEAEYHTAEIRTVEQGRQVLAAINALQCELAP